MRYSKLFFGSDTQNEVLVKQLAFLTLTFVSVTMYVSKYLVANSNSLSVLVVLLFLSFFAAHFALVRCSRPFIGINLILRHDSEVTNT